MDAQPDGVGVCEGPVRARRDDAPRDIILRKLVRQRTLDGGRAEHRVRIYGITGPRNMVTGAVPSRLECAI
jgi:hypothetical protein